MGLVCSVQVYLNGVDVSRSSAYYMSLPPVVISITTQASASTMGLLRAIQSSFVWQGVFQWRFAGLLFWKHVSAGRVGFGYGGNL
jgi:hypothetical protein